MDIDDRRNTFHPTWVRFASSKCVWHTISLARFSFSVGTIIWSFLLFITINTGLFWLWMPMNTEQLFSDFRNFFTKAKSFLIPCANDAFPFGTRSFHWPFALLCVHLCVLISFVFPFFFSIQNYCSWCWLFLIQTKYREKAKSYLKELPLTQAQQLGVNQCVCAFVHVSVCLSIRCCCCCRVSYQNVKKM